MGTIVVHEGEIAQRNSAVQVIDRLSTSLGGGVLCSRDPAVMSVRDELTDLIPAEFEGVTRFFLPIAPKMPGDGVGRFSAYTSTFAPMTSLADQKQSGANYALKLVVAGSVAYDRWTLTAGDWLWIPAGGEYSLTSLELGAVVFTALPSVDDSGGQGALEELLESFTRVDEVDALLSSRAGGDFMTSRDPGTREALVSLGDAGPLAERADGVTHRWLPFAPHMPKATLPVLDGRFFAWLSMLEPGVAIPRHSHGLEKIADIKVVISGSIHCGDRELTAGDWLWAPSGGSYEFTAGTTGALLMGGWPWN
jgi:quercetin dioxygenase-like cupin family protein